MLSPPILGDRKYSDYLADVDLYLAKVDEIRDRFRARKRAAKPAASPARPAPRPFLAEQAGESDVESESEATDASSAHTAKPRGGATASSSGPKGSQTDDGRRRARNRAKRARHQASRLDRKIEVDERVARANEALAHRRASEDALKTKTKVSAPAKAGVSSGSAAVSGSGSVPMSNARARRAARRAPKREKWENARPPSPPAAPRKSSQAARSQSPVRGFTREEQRIAEEAGAKVRNLQQAARKRELFESDLTAQMRAKARREVAVLAGQQRAAEYATASASIDLSGLAPHERARLGDPDWASGSVAPKPVQVWTPTGTVLEGDSMPARTRPSPNALMSDPESAARAGLDPFHVSWDEVDAAKAAAKTALPQFAAQAECSSCGRKIRGNYKRDQYLACPNGCGRLDITPI